MDGKLYGGAIESYTNILSLGILAPSIYPNRNEMYMCRFHVWYCTFFIVCAMRRVMLLSSSPPPLSSFVNYCAFSLHSLIVRMCACNWKHELMSFFCCYSCGWMLCFKCKSKLFLLSMQNQIESLFFAFKWKRIVVVRADGLVILNDSEWKWDTLLQRVRRDLC